MRNSCTIIPFLSLLLIGTAFALDPAPTNQGDWKLVWSDEFNHDGRPDPANWNDEIGFVRNGEPQYYTGRLENVRQENGFLILEARKEEFPNAWIRPPTEPLSQSANAMAHSTSGSITTEGKKSWLYGRFEIRAKLPQGVGTWPAFWTLGISHDWPECGEIDIMEHWARNPKTTTSSIHYSDHGVHRHLTGKITERTPITGFHIYALEWYPDRLDFFFDDKKFYSVPISQINDGGLHAFNKPHFVLLNLALDIGHKWIDYDALPQQFIIDYIRVYQKPGAGE